MITNIMAGLLAIGLIGILKLRVRYDRMFSVMMFLATAYIFYIYMNLDFSGIESGFSFLWEKTKIGDITIDFYPSDLSNLMIKPIFFISVYALLSNNIFRYEERIMPLNALIILNLIVLSLIICAKNYVQLMTMIFVSDIIGYLTIKNADSLRKYVIYNFFADMCLFMLLAMACGKIQSLDITRLLGYEQIGRHKDFVGICAALAIFIKIGCFPFYSYLTDIKTARFSRIIIANVLGTPLSGILMLLKLHNLLFVSNLMPLIYQIVTVATFITGIIGFVHSRNMLKKVISLDLALRGMLMQILWINGFEWNRYTVFYLIGIYLFNHLFYEIFIYQKREVDIVNMPSVIESNERALKFLLFRETLLMSLSVWLVWQIAWQYDDISIVLGITILLAAVSIVLHHIYKTPLKNSQVIVCGKEKNIRQSIFECTNMLVLGMGFFYLQPEISSIIAIAIIFLVMIASSLGKPFYQIYAKKDEDKNDLVKNLFFYIIAVPLTYLSRRCWLFIDLILSEKIITAAISAVGYGGERLFLQLNGQKYRTPIRALVLGIILCLLCYHQGGQ
ncbi:MAG: hypothetical protein IJ864_02145 [Alphaproteobacteria bacterium]|nr:hypothetical protein [Alphaproteobacteria bacterium]